MAREKDARVISIRLAKDTYAALKAICKHEDRSVNYIGVKAMEQYIGNIFGGVHEVASRYSKSSPENPARCIVIENELGAKITAYILLAEELISQADFDELTGSASEYNYPVAIVKAEHGIMFV